MRPRPKLLEMSSGDGPRLQAQELPENSPSQTPHAFAFSLLPPLMVSDLSSTAPWRRFARERAPAAAEYDGDADTIVGEIDPFAWSRMGLQRAFGMAARPRSVVSNTPTTLACSASRWAFRLDGSAGERLLWS